jgi:hypothetical protein
MITEYVPVQVATESFTSMPDAVAREPVRSLADRIRQEQFKQLPDKLSDLPFTDTLSFQTTNDIAASLGLPVARAEASYSSNVFIQQFQRYNVLEEAGERVLFGVGVRWIVEVTKIDAKANLSSLPLLVASAQFGYVRATVRFDVIGMISEEIDRVIPAPTVLNVETHVEYAKALKAVMALLWRPETIIKPQILSIPARISEPYERAIVIAHSIQAISEGKSVRQACAMLGPRAEAFKDTIQSVYDDLAQTTGEDVAPSEEGKRLARQRLLGSV